MGVPGHAMKSLVVIIPARGGSKGLRNKNLLAAGGLSLVARAVLTARQFARRVAVDATILVDTDSEEIARDAVEWGAVAPFLRPERLARDDTPTVESVLHAVDQLAAAGRVGDTVLLLQLTSPLRTVDDVAACWAPFDLLEHPTVVFVCASPHPGELLLSLASVATA